MKRQCQGRTTKGTRCHNKASRFATVVYSDGIREFCVCWGHLTAINQRVFRPAINQPVTRLLTLAEKLSGEVAQMIVGTEGKVSG